MRTVGPNARKLIQQAKYLTMRGAENLTSLQHTTTGNPRQAPTPAQPLQSGYLIYDRWWMTYDDTDFEYVND